MSIYSPTKGNLVRLELVPDDTFAKKMLGDGAALEIEEDIICAPQDGTIKVLFPSKHAFVVETKEGIEILVHIGLDTVNLQGEGFEAIAKVEDKVKVGDPIIKVNRDLIKSKGFNLITMVIVANIENIKDIIMLEEGNVNKMTEIVKCKL
ncbi:PTS system, glucose subfamily, IIA component [Clostridium pasteurianum BC1]|uniref:PTS system, glucose subfamily, IIA component n=1 Tax=Clostridium pasteurianum BC1 TaxID=86416 RepID=R4KBG0_CLOPA|nr:PTS system, glucose subfamily, IIA component [Clostridium pasteurianum BC1]